MEGGRIPKNWDSAHKKEGGHGYYVDKKACLLNFLTARPGWEYHWGGQSEGG